LRHISCSLAEFSFIFARTRQGVFIMSPAIPKTNPWLERLIRGEMSAVETYQQAIKALPVDEDLPKLQTLLRDHVEAVTCLRDYILAHGTLPPDSSGLWGTWASAIEGTATMLGKTAALRALKAGEEHGIHDYWRALRDDSLPFDGKELISNTLMPVVQSHRRVLNEMIQHN
jgi:hypothetical protein